MNELNQSGDINQKVNTIIEEIKRPEPNKSQIIDSLYDLRTKEEYQSLSPSEFYDIVGKTFISNPEYFMKNIYREWKVYGKMDEYIYKNRKEMDKYILEKFCLYDGEQILYECNGELVQKNLSKVKVLVDNAAIFITNYRIIAQGTLKVSGGHQELSGGGLIGLVILSLMYPLTGHGKRSKSKTDFIEGSTDQELPCYGYQFKTKNHYLLKKKSNGVKYEVNLSEFVSSVSVMRRRTTWRNVRITILPYPNEEQVNNLFKVLCKDTNQIMSAIRELLHMESDQKKKEIEVLRILHLREYFPSKGKIGSRWQSDEIHQFSDSDYLDIVKQTYKLDPEFFMASIFPEMMSWNYSKFISVIDVKEEIKNLVDKLSKESGV